MLLVKHACAYDQPLDSSETEAHAACPRFKGLHQVVAAACSQACMCPAVHFLHGPCMLTNRAACTGLDFVDCEGVGRVATMVCKDQAVADLLAWMHIW
jgi:hypothetical protein